MKTTTLPLISTTRISSKEAVQNAITYFKAINGDIGKYRLQLEEIENDKINGLWYVTLGIYTPTDSMMLLTQGIKENLSYKIFKIDARDGEILSMKIRIIDFNKLK